MRDLLDPTLLAAVLASRASMASSQAELVDARAGLWRAARGAGHEPTSHRFGQLQLLPDELLETMAGRSDRAADAVRAAYAQLCDAERAATAACDAAAHAMRDLRGLLPAAYRSAELVERTLGRPSQSYHRVFALEAPGVQAHTASTALCGRKRSVLWRAPARRPLRSELCRPCQLARQGAHIAAEAAGNEPAGSRLMRLRRLRDFDLGALRRAFPVISLFGAVLVAGGLLEIGPLADHPLVRLVLASIRSPIGPG
jgi:hypothetical protein